jgi:hypothetical protein
LRYSSSWARAKVSSLSKYPPAKPGALVAYAPGNGDFVLVA